MVTRIPWFADYRNERKVELAYEGHLFWDMRRWKLAHIEYHRTFEEAGQLAAICLPFQSEGMVKLARGTVEICEERRLQELCDT